MPVNDGPIVKSAGGRFPNARVKVFKGECSVTVTFTVYSLRSIFNKRGFRVYLRPLFPRIIPSYIIRRL